MNRMRLVRLACVMAVLVLIGGGCATQAMKGTPFYTGEWEQRSGPVEDRVALWPFVYYRASALSVLWPIFEKTPDHLAVRPLYKVTGLESGRKVHNWPGWRAGSGRRRARTCRAICSRSTPIRASHTCTRRSMVTTGRRGISRTG